MRSDQSSYATKFELNRVRNAARTSVSDEAFSDLNYGPLDEKPARGTLAKKNRFLGTKTATLQIHVYERGDDRRVDLIAMGKVAMIGAWANAANAPSIGNSRNHAAETMQPKWFRPFEAQAPSFNKSDRSLASRTIGIELSATDCPDAALQETGESDFFSEHDAEDVTPSAVPLQAFGGERPQDKKRVIQWCVAVAIVAGAHLCVAAFFHHVSPYSSQIFPDCIWRQITGWNCPGCGGTRALYSLFSGDVIASVRMNPLVVASYSAAVLIGAQAIASAIGKRTVRWPHWLAMSLIVSAAVYSGIIRNL
jgi:hypothetical protein